MQRKTKDVIKKEFQLHENDGFVRVQVALLTGRIEDLTQHLKTHRKTTAPAMA